MFLESATIEARERSFAPAATEGKSLLMQNYGCGVKTHSFYRQFLLKAMLKSSNVKTNQATNWKAGGKELSVLVSSIISNIPCLCISLYSFFLASSRLRKLNQIKSSIFNLKKMGLCCLASWKIQHWVFYAVLSKETVTFQEDVEL